MMVKHAEKAIDLAEKANEAKTPEAANDAAKQAQAVAVETAAASRVAAG
jgi:predicted RNase H-like HicB family nuclease